MSARTFSAAGVVRRTRFSLPRRISADGAAVVSVADMLGSMPKLSLNPRAKQAPCDIHGVGETARAGLLEPGEAKRRAVVRARAHEWQTEGDVHRLVKLDRFERREPLVV